MCASSSKRAFVRSGTDVGREDLACISIYPKGVTVGLRPGLYAENFSSWTSKLVKLSSLELAWYTGAQSLRNQKIAFLKLWQNLGMAKLSLYAIHSKLL